MFSGLVSVSGSVYDELSPGNDCGPFSDYEFFHVYHGTLLNAVGFNVTGTNRLSFPFSVTFLLTVAIFFIFSICYGFC